MEVNELSLLSEIVGLYFFKARMNENLIHCYFEKNTNSLGTAADGAYKNIFSTQFFECRFHRTHNYFRDGRREITHEVNRFVWESLENSVRANSRAHHWNGILVIFVRIFMQSLYKIYILSTTATFQNYFTRAQSNLYYSQLLSQFVDKKFILLILLC